MKHILIVMGSGRRHGNTELLAEAFAKGARKAGAIVTEFYLADAKINPCRACMYCESHNGKCVQQDDMQKLYQLLQENDTLVLASPVYYLGFPGSVKNVIDRTYAESVLGREIKNAVLLSSACKSEKEVTDVMVYQYEKLTAYLGFKNLGMVNALGMEGKDTVLGTTWMEEAEEMGKTVAGE